jgi:hypothetical protein
VPSCRAALPDVVKERDQGSVLRCEPRFCERGQSLIRVGDIQHRLLGNRIVQLKSGATRVFRASSPVCRIIDLWWRRHAMGTRVTTAKFQLISSIRSRLLLQFEFFGFFPASARRARRSYPSAMLNMIRFASGSDISSALARASAASVRQCSATSISDGTISPPPERPFDLNVRLASGFPCRGTRARKDAYRLIALPCVGGVRV